MFVDALSRSLRQFKDISVLQPEPTRGIEALHAVLHNRPDVAIIDYWMPDMMGDAITRHIIERLPNQKVLLFSWFYGPQAVREALDAGAVGFLSRDLNVEELADAIRMCHSGETHAFLENSGRIVDRIGAIENVLEAEKERLLTLTPREIEILQAISKGYPMKKLATKLSITAGTLQVHIHNILRKVNAQTHVQAVDMARRHQLIAPEL